MPALASVTLTDRTPVTPVTFTYVPRDIVDGVGTVISSSGVPLGEKRCTVSMKKRNNRFVGDVRMVNPVVVTETINGVSRPVIVRTAYLSLTVSFDEKSTEQERNDMVGFLSSACSTGKPLFNDTLVKLEGVY